MSTKKKILLLSDHPLSVSGVGTQARWLINGLLETKRYTFRCFGAALKHQDKQTVVVNEDFIIRPTEGFGDPNMIRQVLAMEQPDALMLFTDPRFFIWVWEIEDEIHQVCPIVYNHLWDNPPWPEYNRVLYESTDLLNCINWPTYEMVKERFPEKTNYIPHAVPPELYFPMKKEDVQMVKRRLIGPERADHFIALYVGRNARRKMVNDICVSWKMFLNELEKKHGHRKATLLLHTDPFDPEGANLHHVLECFNLKNDVVFSKDRIAFEDMNSLYNIADVQLNRSCNEGFGLPTLEGAMAGTPMISIVTGGLGRQVRDHITGEEYGVALDPEVRALVGNQMIPYIYEDYVSHETYANAIMKMYEMGPEAREEIGKKAIEHVKRDYVLTDLVEKWDKTLTECIESWSDKHERWNYTEI
jgi:glycosyltransferase involved in cell wall biosynthesis